MPLRIAFWGVITAVLGSSPVMAALGQPVRTEAGLVQGIPATNPAITVYKGIRYAAAPTGELRWRPPQPPSAWSGVQKADRFGSLCPQAQSPRATLPMSEDCLFLNVWTGASAVSERRPVFVWIYGGGFSGGSGSSPEFDGESLARKGLVVVTFNYRLGALGFLATPELSKESGHEASGNYGLLDDIALLKWVRRNIAAFGGDPERVTIGGQSAGAGSVGFLSISPLARGLFQRSVAESHARYPRDPELRYLSVSWRPLKTAESAGVRFATARGRIHSRSSAPCRGSASSSTAVFLMRMLTRAVTPDRRCSARWWTAGSSHPTTVKPTRRVRRTPSNSSQATTSMKPARCPRLPSPP